VAQFVHPNTPNQLVTAGVPRLVVTKSVQVFLAHRPRVETLNLTLLVGLVRQTKQYSWQPPPLIAMN
jgi:hypothetical protein